MKNVLPKLNYLLVTIIVPLTICMIGCDGNSNQPTKRDANSFSSKNDSSLENETKETTPISNNKPENQIATISNSNHDSFKEDTGVVHSGNPIGDEEDDGVSTVNISIKNKPIEMPDPAPTPSGIQPVDGNIVVATNDDVLQSFLFIEVRFSKIEFLKNANKKPNTIGNFEHEFQKFLIPGNNAFVIEMDANNIDFDEIRLYFDLQRRVVDGLQPISHVFLKKGESDPRNYVVIKRSELIENDGKLSPKVELILTSSQDQVDAYSKDFDVLKMEYQIP